MTLQIYEVIDDAIAAKSKADKIQVLRDNETWALKDLLRGTYDDTVSWLLPTGDPPFESPEEHNAPKSLHTIHKDFIYLVKGGKGEGMQTFRREKMFIDMLEVVPPGDAKLLLLMKDKKQLGKGLTKKLVEEAFPNLIQK